MHLYIGFCMRCCVKTTIYKNACRPPTNQKKIKKSLTTGSESELWSGTTLGKVSAFPQDQLPGANRWLVSMGISVPSSLLAVTHTGNLYYSLPVLRHALAYVCYLEHHAQAQLTHAMLVSLNEVYNFLSGSICQVIVI